MNLLPHVGKLRGRLASKWNKAAKLLAGWEPLVAKMRAFAERGRGRTEQARLAIGVLVMLETGIRVGNEGSAEGFVCDLKHHELYGQEVQTYGLTTLEQRHVERLPDRLRLSFCGKKLVGQELTVLEPAVLAFAPCRPDPAARWLGIEYEALKRFVRRSVGPFTPKDLRTACVNRLFCEAWAARWWVPFANAAGAKARKAVVEEAIGETAARIGHTPGICRSAYLSGPMLRHLLGLMGAKPEEIISGK